MMCSSRSFIMLGADLPSSSSRRSEVGMRGTPEAQHPLYYVIDVEALIPAEHPLRTIKRRVDAELARLAPDFARLYSERGRPSIPPEQLLKALLLQALYSIRSERLLVEEISVNLRYRWFLDLRLDAPVWDATTFTKNRERFAEGDLLQRFFDGVVRQAIDDGLVSAEHFSVDGTLLQAWASMKSVKPIAQQGTTVADGAPEDDPGNPSVDFRGERRSNQTHRSVTDPEARLAVKAAGSSPCARRPRSRPPPSERPRWRCWRISGDATGGCGRTRWGPTRATTPGRSCARWSKPTGSCRTWRSGPPGCAARRPRRPPAVARPGGIGRQAFRAVSAGASDSRKPGAGRRPLEGCTGCGTGDCGR